MWYIFSYIYIYIALKSIEWRRKFFRQRDRRRRMKGKCFIIILMILMICLYKMRQASESIRCIGFYHILVDFRYIRTDSSACASINNREHIKSDISINPVCTYTLQNSIFFSENDEWLSIIIMNSLWIMSSLIIIQDWLNFPCNSQSELGIRNMLQFVANVRFVCFQYFLLESADNVHFLISNLRFFCLTVHFADFFKSATKKIFVESIHHCAISTRGFHCYGQIIFINIVMMFDSATKCMCCSL